MLATIKQEIQRYYPHDYVFMEFLRTGGWQIEHQTQFGTRHQVVLDGITFELVEHQRLGEIDGVGGIVIRTFYKNDSGITSIPLLGPNARVGRADIIPDTVEKIMTGIYHSPRFRGKQYHAKI